MESFLKPARTAISWLLIALFGPAPLAPLLAHPAGEPECKMACCRLRHRHLCSEHDAPGTLHIQAANDCLPDCSQSAFSPVAPAAESVTPHDIFQVRLEVTEPVLPAAAPAILVFRDSILHQRPPPLLPA